MFSASATRGFIQDVLCIFFLSLQKCSLTLDVFSATLVANRQLNVQTILKITVACNILKGLAFSLAINALKLIYTAKFFSKNALDSHSG
jgi:hypothetical protein